jgi:hypothetical protein
VRGGAGGKLEAVEGLMRKEWMERGRWEGFIGMQRDAGIRLDGRPEQRITAGFLNGPLSEHCFLRWLSAKCMAERMYKKELTQRVANTARIPNSLQLKSKSDRKNMGGL